MKQLTRLSIGLGLILVGMSGMVQAQTIYNSLYDTSFSSLQIKWHDHIDCQLNRCQVEPPPPPPPGHTGAKRSDFDGDGTEDIVWHSERTGDVYMWFMNGTTRRSALIAPGISLLWKIVGVSDLNGDGKADLVWR
jgi:VCBS repeat protein